LSAGKLHILVIENDPAMGNLLRKVLIRDGFTVTLAASNKEFAEKFRSGDFDVVIIDENTGKLSHADITKQIKEKNPETNIIIITPFSNIDAGQEGDIEEQLHQGKLFLCNDKLLNIGHLKTLLEGIAKNKNNT